MQWRGIVRRGAHFNSGGSSRRDSCCVAGIAGLACGDRDLAILSMKGCSARRRLVRADTRVRDGCLASRYRRAAGCETSLVRQRMQRRARICTGVRHSAALCGIIDRERRRSERSGAPRSDAYAPVVTVARADWLRSDGDDAIAVRRTGCGIRSRRATCDARCATCDEWTVEPKLSAWRATIVRDCIATRRNASAEASCADGHERIDPRGTNVPAPRDARVAPMVRCQPAEPSYAAFNAATSNFVICIIAAATRAALTSSRSAIIGISASGTICHETP